jgi:hypothetical protein
MKVDSEIYCHGRLLLLTQTIQLAVSVTTNGEDACFIPSLGTVVESGRCGSPL